MRSFPTAEKLPFSFNRIDEFWVDTIPLRIHGTNGIKGILAAPTNKGLIRPYFLGGVALGG